MLYSFSREPDRESEGFDILKPLLRTRSGSGDQASVGLRFCKRYSLILEQFALFRLQLVRGEQSETERTWRESWIEPGCSRDQKQACPEGDGPDALTGYESDRGELRIITWDLFTSPALSSRFMR